ncbi:phospholipid-translocating P-type ATPase, flippase family protein [Trichomonas vaginalis G3]|uniref:Phospholipid-transporting ATPase n=1 Tax=Trichomonas vaginalis (strain ATCC PRA-98 / G3) TaxID=412133 RepID=A2EK71_TRIV3|nr:putative phospholipid-transporting ATPase family [Trichomonas vaginalis G3]EAY06964.1 phospholipid-translocating P-type ATPase, flippase family protein [Trichomonas vaginalis G3]KAI5499114.1 putative phospholipid-transporting ATPase family [Trichomonas vaginalis G3]|eukprot:XP_001319187.1 phospholipid-translocating P-type ATPase, flippase family protein [Trichomonas vaginalis G3]
MTTSEGDTPHEEQNEGPWAVIPFIYYQDYPDQQDNYVRTTRYKWWSFIPLTLYENFRNLTNIYFLLVLIMSALPYSPVSWIFNFLPLVFVLLVSMIKLGIEDYLKYRQDIKRNKSPVNIYRFGEWTTVESHQIHVGDLVMIKAGDTVPCDMLYLTSSNPNHTTNYSETSLNGESAIKTMSPHPAFENLEIPKTFFRKQFYVHVGPPSANLYKFDAKLVCDDQKWGISIHNILLRGCVMHFTDYVIGVALRTGHDCTIMKNRRSPPAKMTKFDRDINKMIIYIFCSKLTLVISLSIANMILQHKTALLSLVRDSYGLAFIKTFMQFFILLSYMIPISLMVTIEIIRVFHMLLIHWDYGMFYEEFGYAELHNSNMIVTLAKITHVLSDKTGTLTENIMQLVRFVDETGANKSDEFSESVKSDPNNLQKSLKFIKCLALCNDVVVYHNPSGITEYNAESPDEASFVKYANECGVSLNDHQPTSIEIHVTEPDGSKTVEKYTILSHIPFNSDRKRMTVVLQKEGSEELVVYSKGADSIMYPLCNEVKYDKYVNKYALAGFRTLVFATRTLTNSEAQEWRKIWNYAESTIENRDEEIAKAAKYVECKLDVVGVSAVEDKLQPNLQDAIMWLRKANIALWVLTGDKLETAIEIGKTSSIILPGADTLVLSNPDEEEFKKQINQYNSNFDEFTEPVLVLTAETTTLALNNRDLFMSLATKCRSCIFSRVSPIMKATIVSMVKERQGTMTLAIGDGANDVGMIQEAHIGVGVFGREGSQAAQSADFAIPRFKHLTRLISVHGTWAYVRFPTVAVYMLYKNFVFILVVIWAACDTLASPPNFYNEFFISCFNLVFTLLTPFAFGFWEQNLSAEVLEKHPELHGLQSNPMEFKHLLYYLLLAIYQSAINYIIIRFSLRNNTFEANGCITYYAVVHTVTLQLMIWTKNYNGCIIAAFCLQFILLYCVSSIYCFLVNKTLQSSLMSLFGEVEGWFTLFAAVVCAIIPPLVFEVLIDYTKPSLERLMNEKVNKDNRRIKYDSRVQVEDENEDQNP